MANNIFNPQIQTIPEKTTGGAGQKPLPAGPKDVAMPERTASWPGLPGKAGPNRSAGVQEEKVYAYAQGICGATDDDPGPSKDPSLGGKF